MANAMIIYSILQVAAVNANNSYWTAWLGLWAFAEISLGLVMTGTFMLPKFFEVKGSRIRIFFSSFTRHFTSLGSGSSPGTDIRSRRTRVASQDEVGLDSMPLGKPSKSDCSLSNHTYDIERLPSHDGNHGITRYP